MTPTYKESTSVNARILTYLDHFNRRIRIDEYNGCIKEVCYLIKEAEQHWVEKVIVKVKKEDVPSFLAHGFTMESYIEGYFLGEGMYFFTKYLDSKRQSNQQWEVENAIIDKILSSEKNSEEFNVEEVQLVTEADLKELSSLYKNTFPLYPTPLDKIDYLKKTMSLGTVYVCIYDNGKMVSAASAEINEDYKNAELTDCATSIEAQGKGHMKKLLSFLEKHLHERGINCLYTIARANSPSMNKVFYNLDFTFGGCLINNCYIGTGLENLNVWYKNR